jgi:hypothetical protein
MIPSTGNSKARITIGVQRTELGWITIPMNDVRKNILRHREETGQITIRAK